MWYFILNAAGVLTLAVTVLQNPCYTQGLILLPVVTGEFPGGPENFVMRRSGGPVDFWDVSFCK